MNEILRMLQQAEAKAARRRMLLAVLECTEAELDGYAKCGMADLE